MFSSLGHDECDAAFAATHGTGAAPSVRSRKAATLRYAMIWMDVGLPRPHFHSYLRRLVEAGFGKRIMFGSDQNIWPEAIPIALEAVESAEFLTAEDKRDILYNNAARFLRLAERSAVGRE